jgi:hypothetical protein
MDSSPVELKRIAPIQSGWSTERWYTREVLQCNAVQCCTIEWATVQYNALQCSAVYCVPWMSAKGPCLRAPPEKPSACR